MRPNPRSINKNYNKRNGRVMFPTSLNDCLKVLEKMLKSGNEVLVTTKPYLNAINMIIHKLSEFKEQIQFRFTITSIDDNLLSFFEPNAPSYRERINCLKLIYEYEYKTSVSIEPFLDRDPILLIKEITPYCSESVWIGLMSNFHRVISYLRKRDIRETGKYIEHLKNIYKYQNIKKIVDEIRKLPDNLRNKIRLKDSIRNIGFRL